MIHDNWFFRKDELSTLPLTSSSVTHVSFLQTATMVFLQKAYPSYLHFLPSRYLFFNCLLPNPALVGLPYRKWFVFHVIYAEQVLSSQVAPPLSRQLYVDASIIISSSITLHFVKCACMVNTIIIIIIIIKYDIAWVIR